MFGKADFLFYKDSTKDIINTMTTYNFDFFFNNETIKKIILHFSNKKLPIIISKNDENY
jgi:hypothetical protein